MVRFESRFVDTSQWPAQTLPEVGRIHAAEVADAVRASVRGLGLRIDFPDYSAAGDFDAPARMVLADPDALWARLANAGVRGLAESYMAGEWTAPDLPTTIAAFAPWVAASAVCGGNLPRVSRRIFPSGSRRRDRKVGLEDGLSGDLCSLYTDATMSTTGAVFASGARTRSFSPNGIEVVHLEQPGRRPFRTDLDDAQRRSADALLDLAGVESGSHVLVLPSGFGELPMRSAERGARTRTVTSSTERLAMLGARIEAAGLGSKLALSLDPPSAVTGEFDCLVADEPASARDLAGVSEILATAERLVRPGGRVVIQLAVAPGRPAGVLEALAEFVERYVGDIAVTAGRSDFEHLVHAHRRLRLLGWADITAHHAETARLWRERFAVRARDAAALGFDSLYRRMWNFHLSAVEAGLRSRWVESLQVVLAVD